MAVGCAVCGCAFDAPAHAVAAALADDDLDLALTRGLLEVDGCAGCAPACRQRVAAAREARLRAFAARDRHRARTQRLQRREAERAARRAAIDALPDRGLSAASVAPALPATAAAALARALAKAGPPKR